MQQAEDFRAECRALLGLVSDVSDEGFGAPTQFKGWALNDVFQHLHFWNRMARWQVEDPDALVAELGSMAKGGRTMRAHEAHRLDGLSGAALIDAWRNEFERTADVYTQADPKARLKWVGPDMSARSSITARLMETWAHGQEVYDHLGVVRQNEDRIRNIVVLGVNTFGWTYATRKETPPGPMPELALTAPSGEIWQYGEADGVNRISGPAEAFCQVVTQVRNVADVELVVEGPAAQDWMSKAQCFAGPPETPPAPGTRFTMSA